MTTTLTRPDLTAADRCDRCNAAAQVRALLPSGGELLFCGHHAREHSERLRELEAEIQNGAEILWS
jgi:Zn ribbon nucleic-acid-binding protein